MVTKLETYQNLADDNSSIIRMMQNDKDFMDRKLMAIKDLIENSTLNHTYKENILELVRKARGRV